MSAMEKMLSSMLGINPEQLAEMATNLTGLISNISNRITAIEETQKKILQHLERAENDDCNSDGKRE